MITTTAYGQQSEEVRLDGALVGTISGSDTLWLGLPAGTHGIFRFASHEDAVAACVSHATVGYWTNEI